MEALAIGLGVVGVVLVLAIIAAGVLITWLCCKLRQHETDILKLQDTEQQMAHTNGTTTGASKVERKRANADSAIDLSEIDTRRPFSQSSVVSNISAAQRRMTIIIHKEETNVYGRQPDLSQMMMAAQNYYKGHTNKNTDVPVENVELVDVKNVKKPALSKIFTEDWRMGSPTSFLLNGSADSFDDMLTVNKGIFVHKTIGPNGGRLDISGVSLEIPAGALGEEKMISLGVLWDEKFAPKLTKKQTILSPIILCQPSGLKFKTTVTLKFPHAAQKITTNWIPKILKRNGDLKDESENDWEPITLADYEERNVDEHRISLSLYHFTLYTLVGEARPDKIAAKLVHLVAFTNKLEKGTFFKPRIYCLNKYKELGDVREKQSDLNSSSDLADTTELIIHDNENDVMVELMKLSDGWNVAGDKIEALQFEHIWHGFHPHCTFLMKQKKSAVSEIVCEFHAYQSGAENRSAKLKIAEIMAQPSSPLSAPREDPLEDLIRELIIMLDPENVINSDAGDWRTLAEKMGCSVPRIRWLGTQVSQTRILIEKWIEDKRTFTELKQVLLDINRPDAAEEVQKRLHELDLSTDS